MTVVCMIISPDASSSRLRSGDPFSICPHLKEGWFDTEKGHPTFTRDPDDTLKDLLHDIVVTGNCEIDRQIHDEIMTTISQTRAYPPSQTFQKNSEERFHLFQDLPIELRLKIWTMALPSRTLYFGTWLWKGEPGHWNLHIPYPALALACREALYAVRDTLHEINDNQVFNVSRRKIAPAPSQNRTQWITTADTLSICHDIRISKAWETLLLYRPVLPHLANVAIPFEALQQAEKYPQQFTGYRICADDVRSMRRIQVVVQTVMFFVPNGWGRLRERFPKDEEDVARLQETGFEDPVTVIDPEEMGDWSGYRGDNREGMCFERRFSDRRQWKHFQTRHRSFGRRGARQERDDEFEDLSRFLRYGDRLRGNRLDWMSSMHRTTVVDLYDRARLRELFEFAKAFRPGASESGQDRLDAILNNPKRAFCVDCLIQWWEKQGSRIAEDAVAGIKPQSEEDMQKWPRGDPVAPEEALPTIVPAVQFCFRFNTTRRAPAPSGARRPRAS